MFFILTCENIILEIKYESHGGNGFINHQESTGTWALLDQLKNFFFYP